MATVNIAYAADTAITIGLHSTPLAPSATFVAGRESTVIDNTSPKYDDCLLSGKITVGSTVTANTNILVYVFSPFEDGPSYPDQMTGSDGDRSITTAGVGAGFLKLAAVITVDATTANRTYYFGQVSVAQLFGGIMPAKWSVWVTGNWHSSSALNSTSSNHALYYQGITYTVA